MRFKLFFTCGFLAVMLIFTGAVFAGEETLFEASKDYYSRGDYYNAVTEAMRYQYLYPQGVFYSGSLLVMSKALYKAGDKAGAISTVDKCGELFAGSPSGDEASYLAGRMRVSSRPVAAMKRYDQYINFYNNSLFTEMVYRDRSFASLFLYDFDASKRWAEQYKQKYPQGAYLAHVDRLLVDIQLEENRKLKSMGLAVAGSVFIPGFGYFYTGEYMLGALTFATNIILIAIIADGIIRGNIFQWAFFGLIELSFYQYSIYGAMSSVQKYNSRDEFVGRMKLRFEKDFDLF